MTVQLTAKTKTCKKKIATSVSSLATMIAALLQVCPFINTVVARLENLENQGILLPWKSHGKIKEF